MISSKRHVPQRATAFAALLLIASAVSAQDQPAFDDVAAGAELDELLEQLDSEGFDNDDLIAARERVVRIERDASDCAAEYGATRARLEERFEPLKDIDPDEVSQEMMAQRSEVRGELDSAVARQTACGNVADRARSLVTTISDRQKTVAQQFLSAREQSYFEVLSEIPAHVASWPARFRSLLKVDLVDGMTGTRLLWALVVAGLVATFVGLWMRRRFRSWHEAAGGGDEMTPRLSHLFFRPLADFAPIWLAGALLLAVLAYAIPDPTSSLAVVRIAWSVLIFGVCLAIINWFTGPLSPAADVEGLIPEHVSPLRRRLRLLLLAICSSYVVLGNDWMSVSTPEALVASRATAVLFVGATVLFALAYFSRIPGLRNRYTALRLLAMGSLGVGIIALLTGYQNLAAYLIQATTLTCVAMFILWSLLWLTASGFNYLVSNESPTATEVRTLLGISGKRSATGIGFMQLIVDLVIWINVIVFLIYVWDNTGRTLAELQELMTQGWMLGDVRIVPKNILNSILIFAVLIVLVGWMKRWIDRRWLERIVIDRGARDAILTLFGYFGFVVAIVLALVLANVDLTGLAIISGALAIGLGFGLQAIANNFVSGLILLFERPIRVGDFVSVGTTEGHVRSIRIRATEIETLDNQNVLVPNSELISGRVTNWVLRDTQGRLQVRVGVAYGSDTELVKEILERIGREHPEVITDGTAPAPRALFTGFGESSLDFELRVRVRSIERRFTTLSDINFAIDKAFREAGIRIPFPQRDLHIVPPGGEEPPGSGKTPEDPD